MAYTRKSFSYVILKTKRCLSGYKKIYEELKIVIYVLLFIFLFGSILLGPLIYLYKVIDPTYIEMDSSDENTKNMIRNVLNKTDKNTVSHIWSISVVDDVSKHVTTRAGEDYNKYDNSAGIAKIIGHEPFIKTDIIDFPFFVSHIYIESTEGSYTLNHEIGHVDGFRNFGDESEVYANNYASQHT